MFITGQDNHCLLYLKFIFLPLMRSCVMHSLWLYKLKKKCWFASATLFPKKITVYKLSSSLLYSYFDSSNLEVINVWEINISVPRFVAYISWFALVFVILVTVITILGSFTIKWVNLETKCCKVVLDINIHCLQGKLRLSSSMKNWDSFFVKCI